MYLENALSKIVTANKNTAWAVSQHSLNVHTFKKMRFFPDAKKFFDSLE